MAKWIIENGVWHLERFAVRPAMFGVGFSLYDDGAYIDTYPSLHEAVSQGNARFTYGKPTRAPGEAA